jgi:TonB family protein
VKAEPVAAVAKTPVVANVTPDRPSTPVKVAQNPSPALKPVAKTPTSTQPKAAPPPRPARKPAPAVVSKPVPAPAPAPVEKSAPTVLASAPVVAAPAVVVAEPAPKPAAPAAAVGPFFEPSQVNETPRLSGRAALKLPAALNNRTGSEVVIVRALVSQTGQPSRVSLLRRSKGGPELDDVVLAAVNQWTFSPAKKKGEAVSCWFNFAVTLGSDE